MRHIPFRALSQRFPQPIGTCSTGQAALRTTFSVTLPNNPVSRPAIANALRLLRLTPTMLAAIRGGNLSPGHARALLAVADPTDRELLFARVIAEELSVRQAEAAAGEFGRGKRVKTAGNGEGGGGGEGPRPGQRQERRDPDLVAAEQRLIEAFGTKVSVRGDFEKGTITIEYYSMEDLERILEKARGG
jgi:ParB family chromosome partitioning protein